MTWHLPWQDRYSSVVGTAAGRFPEDEIANDPSPGHRRRETRDGSIVDYSAEDIWIRYRLLDDTSVEFERVIDLRAQR